LALILPELLAWIEGKPVAQIEKALGGDPDSDTLTKQVCPRPRELVGSVTPRGFSFIIGLLGDNAGPQRLGGRFIVVVEHRDDALAQMSFDVIDKHAQKQRSVGSQDRGFYRLATMVAA
jgi:hypothetical protein